MKWYIYSLVDPRDHRVRYVGKTNNVRKRLRSHVKDALRRQSRNHRLNWIRSLVDAGRLPTLAIIESGEGDWQAAEKHWIAFYRMAGCALVNATDGGEGVDIHTVKTRASISAKTKAAMAAPEVRAKLLAARSSPEYRARSSAAAKARLAVPEARAKYAAAIKKQWQNPECRAKHLAAMKGHKTSLETRARLSAIAKGRKHSAETRARLSASVKAAWARRRAKNNEVSP